MAASHGGDRRLVGDVGEHRPRRAAERLDLAHGILGLVARCLRIHDDGRAAARQCHRDGAADPSDAAGDERHLTGEFACPIGCHVRFAPFPA